MTAENNRTADEEQIRALIDDWAQAICAQDADRILRHFAPDVVIFDLSPPLKATGADRKGTEAWLDSWQGRIEYEVTDLHVIVDGNLAFTRSLNRIGGTKAPGASPGIWVRVTTCLRKIDGEWKVVHDHSSVPFYMDGSGKAALDLTP